MKCNLNIETILRYSFFINIVFLIVGCGQNSSIYQEKYPNGNLKITSQLLNNKKNGLTFYYYDNGIIASIEKYVNDSINGEVSYYYRSGYLKKKCSVKNGILDGPYYEFYPNGSIKAYRKWEKGKKQGLGEDYWEIDGNIKAVYFSRNDTLAYIRLFDTSGYVIKTEGTPPNISNNIVK